MSDVTIDFAALEAELAKMSPEELKAQLIDLKTKQKIATKKYYNPEAAAKQRKIREAKNKAMVELAKKLGLFEAIDAEATKRATAKLAAEAAESEGAPEVEELGIDEAA